MRFYGLALAAGAFVLGACGGGEKKADTTATTTPPATTPTAGATGAAATPTTGATPPGITGTIHEVKMIGDASGYKFDPANITAKPGDGIKFVMVTGGPHNIAFDAAGIPAAAKTALSAGMPNQQGELSSPMLINPNEAYTISLANVPPGKYPFHCTPHLAMNMKGELTVQ